MSRGGWRIVAAAGVLGLAAWLRLWRLDLIEFKNDDGIVLRLAEDWVRLGQFPLVGMPSSVGVPLPPWFIYVVAPAVAVSRDPRVATALIGVINVAGVAGVALLGTRWFPPIGGFVAGLALAANPWAVFYGRKLWPNDILAPLAVLLFLALDRGVVAGENAWAVAALPISIIGVQVHFAFAVLAPLALVPPAVLAVRRKWRLLILSIVIAALTSVPFALHQVQIGWTDIRVLREGGQQTAVTNADGPASVMSWATSWDTWNLEYVHLDRLLSGRVSTVAAAMQTLLVGFGGVIAVVTLIGVGRPGRSARLRFAGLCLWLLLPAVLTVRHSLDLGERYFPMVAPAAALLIAAAVWWLGARAAAIARAAQGLGLVSVAALAVIHSFMVIRLLNFVEHQYNDTYGLPLAASERVAQDVTAFQARTGTHEAAIEFTGPESGAMAYLVRPHFPRLEVAGVGQVGLGSALASIASNDLDSNSFSSLSAVQFPELRYADGVRVVEAAASNSWMPGQRVRIALTWARSAAAGPVAWEVSLYDVAGARLADQVGPSHGPATADAGPTVLSLFSLPTETGWPPDPVVLGLRRVGADTSQRVSEWRSAPIAAQLPSL